MTPDRGDSRRGFRIRAARESISRPRVNLDAARPKSVMARPKLESITPNFRIKQSVVSEEPVNSKFLLLEEKKRELEIVRQKKNEIIAGNGQKFNSVSTDGRALFNGNVTDDARPRS